MRIKLFLLVLLFSLQIKGQCWKSVFSADGQTFAIKYDNTLWACGVNDYGELGDGTVQTRCSMIQIGTESNWKTICGGWAHTLALKVDGSLWACGNNNYGQLGDGTTSDKHVFIQIGTATDWKEIVSGDKFNLAIKNDGTLWAWGLNDKGQLGDGTLSNKLVPTQIGNDTHWKNIGAGFYHSLATKTDGTLWNWGTDSIIDHIVQPMLVNNDTNWDKVSGGFYCSFSIKQDGTLWGWGINNHGQIGDGTLVDIVIPTQIGNMTNWKKVLPLIWNTAAITTLGTLYVWGNGEVGGVINGPGPLADNVIPTPIAMNGDWDEIATGYFHVLGLKRDQTIWAWGQNNYCQLGDGGTSSQRDSPNQIVCEALNTYSFSEPKDFVIYPNPVSSVLMIRPNGIEQIKKVTVYNLTGKKIVEQIGNGNELNVQELQEGIYLLKIESDKGCQQMKFIKQ